MESTERLGVFWHGKVWEWKKEKKKKSISNKEIFIRSLSILPLSNSSVFTISLFFFLKTILQEMQRMIWKKFLRAWRGNGKFSTSKTSRRRSNKRPIPLRPLFLLHLIGTSHSSPNRALPRKIWSNSRPVTRGVIIKKKKKIKKSKKLHFFFSPRFLRFYIFFYFGHGCKRSEISKGRWFSWGQNEFQIISFVRLKRWNLKATK